MALIREPDSEPLWDSYTSFNVTGRFSRGMNCIGTNNRGTRCAWGIPQNKYDDLRRLLDYIETQPPQETRRYLRDIASLSLCQDFHQNQSYGFEDDWSDMLNDVPYSVVERGPSLEEKLEVVEKKIREVEETNKSLKVRAELWQEQYSRLEVSLGTQLHEERQSLEAERRKVEMMRGVEDELAVGRIARDDLEARVKKYKTQITTIMGNLGSSIASERQMMEEMTRDRDAQRAKVEDIEETIRTQTKKISNLENTASMSVALKGQMQARIIEQDMELKNRGEIIETVKKHNAALLMEAGGLAISLEANKESLESTRAEFTKLENINVSLADQTIHLRSQLNESEILVVSLKGKLSESEDLKRALSESANSLQASLDQETDARKTLEDTERQLAQTVNDFKAEIAALSTSIDALQAETNTLRVEKNQLLEEKSRMQTGMGKGDEEVTRLIEELRISSQQSEEVRKHPLRSIAKSWGQKVKRKPSGQAV